MTRYRVDNANQDCVRFDLSLSMCSEKAALVPLLIEKFRRIMSVESELSIKTVNKILGPVYMEVGDPR